MTHDQIDKLLNDDIDDGVFIERLTNALMQILHPGDEALRLFAEGRKLTESDDEAPIATNAQPNVAESTKHVMTIIQEDDQESGD